MTKNYYCNLCKHRHYSGSKVYSQHKRSANIKQKNPKKKYLDSIYRKRIKEMIDFMSTEKATPKDLSELYDDLSIYDVHYLLKKYYKMPYNEYKKYREKKYGI